MAVSVYSATEDWKDIRGVQMRGAVAVVASRSERRDDIGREFALEDAARLFELGKTYNMSAEGVPATVFLTGLWTQAYPDVVKSLAADPLFELENHSMDHAAWRSPCFGLPAISTDAERRDELTAAAAQ